MLGWFQAPLSPVVPCLGRCRCHWCFACSIGWGCCQLLPAAACGFEVWLVHTACRTLAMLNRYRYSRRHGINGRAGRLLPQNVAVGSLQKLGQNATYDKWGRRGTPSKLGVARFRGVDRLIGCRVFCVMVDCLSFVHSEKRAARLLGVTQ